MQRPGTAVPGVIGGGEIRVSSFAGYNTGVSSEKGNASAENRREMAKVGALDDLSWAVCWLFRL